eukprot:gnl/TRDRNA2_/TRDRNA2_181352_c0_seq1.p2 gnl/TRDRNA2_/TRDRNA2_181352_c0~~gnl/TRDRNA2_/TRDRNA2_181352_c0_seq1.p2  ORF type:complete len:104 (+),score=23.92 gnl/TRDRNA2_/TRDRNA2_181352_c0_seq1:121-432(+)
MLGPALEVCHKLITVPRGTSHGFCNMIKLGTFCRTVVWPCLPAVMLYQYIRLKDEDAFITELLYYKSGSNDAKAFYDTSRIGVAGHWKIQEDMETIRAAANAE